MNSNSLEKLSPLSLVSATLEIEYARQFFTSLEISKSPVSGFCYARNGVCNAVFTHHGNHIHPCPPPPCSCSFTSLRSHLQWTMRHRSMACRRSLRLAGEAMGNHLMKSTFPEEAQSQNVTSEVLADPARLMRNSSMRITTHMKATNSWKNWKLRSCIPATCQT